MVPGGKSICAVPCICGGEMSGFRNADFKSKIEIAYVSLTHEGMLGEASEVVRLRRDNRCWLRRLNLRKDSRLRLAMLRREAALLKPPPSSPPPPADLLSTLLETKLRAP